MSGTWHRLSPFLLLSLFPVPLCAQDTKTAEWRTTASLEAEKVLRDLATKDVGIVVGVLSEGSTEFATFGSAAHDADTLFEIGSITKVFTGIALADASLEGFCSLDTKVQELLPEGIRVPRDDAREITLLDLAQHVSSLPRLPPGFKPGNPKDPYLDLGADELHAALAATKLNRAIGSRYEYSNFAAGLLGHLLASKDDFDYERMLRRRVLQPLQLEDLLIKLDEAALSRLAPGHDGAGKPVTNWNFDALAGAGALRGSARALLCFAEAHLQAVEAGDKGSRIQQALLLAGKTRKVAEGNQELGLGWHLGGRAGARFLWHNGGTGGYRSFLCIDPARRIAVVALTNCTRSVDPIGPKVLEQLR